MTKTKEVVLILRGPRMPTPFPVWEKKWGWWKTKDTVPGHSPNWNCNTGNVTLRLSRGNDITDSTSLLCLPWPVATLKFSF